MAGTFVPDCLHDKLDYLKPYALNTASLHDPNNPAKYWRLQVSCQNCGANLSFIRAVPKWMIDAALSKVQKDDAIS